MSGHDENEVDREEELREKHRKRVIEVCASTLSLKEWMSHYRNEVCDGGKMFASRMDGGKIYLNTDYISTFRLKYAQYIDSGKRDLCYSELVKDQACFHMFYDIDLKGEKLESPAYIDKMLSIIHRVTVQYFPRSLDNELVAMICTTQPKDITMEYDIIVDGVIQTKTDGNKTVNLKKEVSGKKTGYHVIYPYLRVSKEEAKQIRYSCSKSLVSEMDERHEQNIWSMVLDDAPYSSGLKMCGSVKHLECPCGKKKQNKSCDASEMTARLTVYTKLRRSSYRRDEKDFDYRGTYNLNDVERKNPEIMELVDQMLVNPYSTCGVCDRHGMTLENRWYTAEYAIDRHGYGCQHTSDMLQDTEQAMILTSVRCMEGETKTLETMVVPEGFSIAPVDFNRSKYANNLRAASGGAYEKDLVDMNGGSLYELTDEQRTMLVDIISSIRPEYSQLTVREVVQMGTPADEKKKKKSTTAFFTIRVNGNGDSFCTNKNANHHSNTIYFVMSNHFLKQKCFSKNTYNGSCCDGYSLPFALHDGLQRLFFTKSICEDELSGGKRDSGEVESPESPEPKRQSVFDLYGGDF